MSKFGQLLVFESNIDTNTINMENVEPFYPEILVAWSKLQIEKKITTKEDILNEIIWNNKHMLINGKAMFYKEWFNKGIKYIKDIIHENGHFLTTDEINNKYRIAVNIMTYNSIKASIPNPEVPIKKESFTATVSIKVILLLLIQSIAFLIFLEMPR